MADMAGSVRGVGGFVDARCLREKRARKRLARGSDSVVSVLRRAVICVVGWAMVASGDVRSGDEPGVFFFSMMDELCWTDV